MAVRAGLRRGLVKENRFSPNLFLQSMAHGAGHVLVGPRQRELGSFVMVKGGRRPVLVDMAVGALRNPRLHSRLIAVLGCELSSMRVHVALFAFLRSALELNFMGPGQSFVALAAGHPTMGTKQGELRLGVVEALNVNPRPGVMAGLAAERRSVGALGGHPLLELTFMHVFVAGVAGHVRKVEREDLVGPAGESRLVAFGAAHGHVRPRQRILRVLMLGDGKRRAMEILYGVAILAAVLIRRRGELLVMCVLMAVPARRELHLVDRGLARGRVALVASHRHVLSLERILGRGVRLHVEERRLPAIHHVALGAFSLAGPRVELPLVRIIGMAIHAFRKGDLLLEIAGFVALIATHLGVHAEQRILRFRVVELRLLHIHFVPGAGVVAGLASALELSLVRVSVARGARIELHVGVLHRFFRPRREVAFLAGYLHVRAGQGILGL